MTTVDSPRLTFAWDPSNPLCFSLVNEFIAAATGYYRVSAPGLEGIPGNLLTDTIVPAIAEAEIVVVVWSPTDPLWVAFQAGLARGFGKPTISVAPTKAGADAASGAPGHISITPEPTALLDHVTHSKARSHKRPAVDYDLAILLCPSESPDDQQLLLSLKTALPELKHRTVIAESTQAKVAADIIWIVTPYSAVTAGWVNLDPNVANAYEAGRCAGAVWAADSEPNLTVVRVGAVRPISALEHVTRVALDNQGAVEALSRRGNREPITVSHVTLRNVKCFERLDVDLSTSSPLGGAWSCLAGINGAGKSTVLQAIAIALLGRRRAVELGLVRLARMVRRTNGEQSGSSQTTSTRQRDADIVLRVQDGDVERELVIPLGPTGVDERRLLSRSDLPGMELLWERLAEELIVSFGATRNISDVRDRSAGTISPHARRQLTLFDPLAQISSADALLEGGISFRPVLETLARLITLVLSGPDRPFECSVDESDRLIFQREGATLDAIDLPDGFRSVIALLAEIASGWHELHRSDTPEEPGAIHGVALVDELDLHLHPSLQRVIVPRLRSALPGMQFIVTTHSPFVAASFERTELVLLDRSQPDHVRPVDRDILAFTTNEIYDWLLETQPFSEAGQEQVLKSGDEGTLLLYQSPERNAEQAAALMANQDELLEKLRQVKA